MKASKLLRDLISRQTGTPAKNIHLCGPLSFNYAPERTEGISYCEYSTDGVFEFIGFSIEEGFIDLEECISKKYKSRGNHDTSYEDGLSLIDHEKIEEFSFFVIKSGDDSDLPHSVKVEVYSSPNWAKQKEYINQTDLTRWEEWYNEKA